MNDKDLKKLFRAMGSKPIFVNVLVDNDKAQIVACQLKKYGAFDDSEDDEEVVRMENPHKSSYLG